MFEGTPQRPWNSERANESAGRQIVSQIENQSTARRRRPESTARQLCLHELFGSRVVTCPDATALVCGGRTLSYSELDRASNQLARRLRQLGAGPGRLVALYFDRSELPIIAILACHKSGAAYVPIDPTYPADRVHHIVAESQASICLTEGALSLWAPALFPGATFIVLDEEWPRIAQLPSSSLSNTESGVSPEDLAYVVYTSGTTGRPKGVMVEHRHVTRFVHAFNEVCATGPDDRVYQGFSLSFDGSVEEIWMAFSNGSALVVPTRDAPRFGPELGHYLTDLGITYLSTVPTLLSTLTEHVPTLRTLVLSGEVCPSGLVSRWARPGLRILNVYGPTEATVNTTVAECIPGRPVTIGGPLPGYEAHVVDSELRPVPRGAEGELLIGGETLARGYIGQVELTRERFLMRPDVDGGGAKRLYRTGDLVRRNEQGDLEFLGRIDGQVKIRGYRVELAEIESILLEHPQIRSASVRLLERDGIQALAAYVVVGQPPSALDRDEVLSLLQSRVPPYMVPGYLDVVPELPRTTSGKVDRNRLPVPVNPLVRCLDAMIPPSGWLESVIADVWSEVLDVPVISAEDDFFLDLGGHSLLAAQMVTLLRERISRPVAIRDAYQFPTIRRLAAHVDSMSGDLGESGGLTDREPGQASSRQVYESTPRWEHLATWTLQALSTYVVSGMLSIPLVLLLLAGFRWMQGTVSTAALLGLDALLALLTWPALLIFSVGAKWLVIGRYRPGEHRLWTLYYWRWWLVNRIGALSGASALGGTPLLPLYYRLMGAQVGARCTLDTGQCSAWDLVSIGDDTSIGADTQILGYRVENGLLRLGRVDVGNRCFIGIHSALGLNVRMGDDSSLDDQSLLPDHEAVKAGEGRRGSPAEPAPVCLPRGAAPQARRRRAVFGLAHLAAINAMTVAMLLPAIVLLDLYMIAIDRGGPVVGALTALVLVPASVLLYCVYVAGLKRLILHRIAPGTYPVLSLVYLRKWLSDWLMAICRTVLLPVYTTLYLPPLLRLMGARIGRRAEISTVWSLAPELIDVDAESFFADGSIIGGRRSHRGAFEVGFNRIGRRSFVGNGAILPVGSSLGNRCLLGVQSIPPPEAASVPDGTEWLGSPSFALTHRPKVGNFDESVTFKPTVRLYVQRGVIDGLRILIPGYLSLAALTMSGIALFFLHGSEGTGAMVLEAPIIFYACWLCSVLGVVALKKSVMGTYRPEIKPLWSMYVWLNEMVNGAYESVVAPVIAPLLGTPFLASFLRLMGCRIGQHTYLGTTLFSEFDLVEVGDYAALNHGVVVQNHLFEDRVFKSSSLRIGDEVSVGNMSVVLYDSRIEEGAFVGPLSLLMKGETLRPRTRWHGIPTVEVSSSRYENGPLAAPGGRVETRRTMGSGAVAPGE
jgi:non-ribosomal peptide synthetase-like protein